MDCGHREQRPVNEPVQEKKKGNFLPGPQWAPLKCPIFLSLFVFYFPIIDTSKKKHTQCTVIITKEYVLR